MVCPSCSRWNLTPIEERWEAVEECEKSFEKTVQRFSTDNIGLARHKSGLELVRVGKPIDTEFAFWRYGLALQRRWKKNAVLTGIAASAIAVGALTSSFIAGASVGFLVPGLHVAPNYLSAWRTVTYVQKRRRERIKIYGRAVPWTQTAVDSSGNYDVRVQHWLGDIILTGDPATQFLTKALPFMNHTGRRHHLDHAVKEVRQSESPAKFASSVLADVSWREAARRKPRKASDATSAYLAQMPHHLRFGLEMALNESREEQALAGELAALETAWKEAEEIAAVADNLLLPKNWKAFRRKHSEELDSDS